jgi:rubrerythrin/predicted acyl esterase
MTKKIITLTLAVALVLAFSSMAPAADEFVKGFNKNCELYPDWIGVDAQGLPTTMPIFNYSAGNYISEEVWVEVPCDTDRDGKRDRISVWIRRPVTKEGFLCPVVMELSPYHEGTVGWSRVNAAAFNNSTDPHVKDLQSTLRYHDNYPITPDINPDTTNLTYNDIKYKGTEAWDPIWWSTSGAFTVDSWYTGVTRGQVPAATVPTGVAKANPQGTFTGLNFTYSYATPARHQQYFVRGYATIYGQVIGSRSCTGISNLRHVEEWLCGAAIIRWLNGETPAFTTRDGSVQVICDWANGHVAIDGVSYPGSTPTVTAMTSVPGVKVIMPEANTSNQFDYYRAGGGVSSPGGYGGEDINLHASYNFSRFNADVTSGVPLANGPNFAMAAQRIYVETQKYMMAGQDRATGDYNVEWDVRNQTRGFGSINPDVAVLQTNGLIDWNIKPKSAYLMLQGMRDKMKGTHKMITGLSSHTSQSGRLVMGKDGVERGMLKWYLMFMDKHMLGLDNHVDDLMYDINVANNITGVMEGYDYDTATEERGTIVPGTHYQNIYFTLGPAGKAGRLSYQKPAAMLDHFDDVDIISQLGMPTPQGTAALSAANRTTIPVSSNGNQTVNSAQAAFCEDRYLGINRSAAPPAGTNVLDYADKPIAGRLLYISEPLTERVRVSGATTVHLSAATDKGVGTISAALLEIGRKARIDSGRSSGSAQSGGSATVFPAANGAGAQTAARYANPVYAATNLSNYKWVTWGHTDVQNPTYDGKSWFDVPEQNYVPNHYFQTTLIKPGAFYDYVVELYPFDYTFEVGCQIAIMVYSTDPNYSPLLLPQYTPKFDIQLGDGSYVNIPLKIDEPAQPVTIEAISSKTLVELGDTVDVTYSVKGNDYGFTELKLELPFDSNLLNPLTVTPGALLGAANFDFNVVGNVVQISATSQNNLAGDGLLFTVTYQVKETAPRVFNTPLDIVLKTAKYSSILDKIIDLDVVIKGSALKTYDFTAYLVTDTTTVVVDDTVLVDVMFIGDKSFTQLATEISYDAGLLEYSGYTNLYGWAAAVTKPADGKIAVRSVPGMNMVIGAPCSSEIKIVTLKFKAKGSFSEGRIDTALTFATSLASPAGGVTGTFTAPGKPADITLLKQTYANLYAAVTGETNAAAFYRASAAKALADGYPVIAQLFNATADAEAKHADDEWAILVSMGATVRPVADTPTVGTTAENLKAAFDGETYEYTVMYPAFVAAAQAEGFADATRIFRFAMAAEEVHAGNYIDVLTMLQANNIAGINAKYAVVYRCVTCGEVVTVLPANCPICGRAGDTFAAYGL